jgi:hypothetical protein
LRRGDTISINCVFNTETGTAWSKPPDRGSSHGGHGDGMLHTAMGPGDEMCGALVMYYPHDYTQRFAGGAIIGGGSRTDIETRKCYEFDFATGACKGEETLCSSGSGVPSAACRAHHR